jgi:hypothetical protein
LLAGPFSFFTHSQVTCFLNDGLAYRDFYRDSALQDLSDAKTLRYVQIASNSRIREVDIHIISYHFIASGLMVYIRQMPIFSGFFGDPARIRTWDLQLRRLLLYPLSYGADRRIRRTRRSL